MSKLLHILVASSCAYIKVLRMEIVGTTAEAVVALGPVLSNVRELALISCSHTFEFVAGVSVSSQLSRLVVVNVQVTESRRIVEELWEAVLRTSLEDLHITNVATDIAELIVHTSVEVGKHYKMLRLLNSNGDLHDCVADRREEWRLCPAQL